MLGGFSPLPLRLTADAESGLAADQHARIAADLVAAVGNAPFAVLTVDTVTGEILSYLGQNGVGIQGDHLPTVVVNSPGDVTLTWDPAYPDDFGVMGPFQLRAASATRVGLATSPRLVTETFIANGTWTRPDGVSEAIVEAWAAGGGGLANTGAGGSGAYARSVLTGLASATYAITTGAVGVDTTGGDATFGTTLVVANGGQSRTAGGAGGTAAASTGQVKYDGAAGGTGTGNRAGGGSPGNAGAGSTSVGGEENGAYGASAALGGSPGAGGGSTTFTGFAGSRGEVRVTYIVDTSSVEVSIVGRRTTRPDEDTTHVLLPPDETEIGDMLVALWSCSDNFVGPDHTPNDDWVRPQINDQNNTALGAIYYRLADGTAADTLTITTAAGVSGNGIVMAIRNGGVPNTQAFSLGTGTSPNSDAPDPLGAGPARVWIAAMMAVGAVGVDITAAPTGFGSVIRTPLLGNVGSFIAACDKVSTATSENPGAWTLSASCDWVAYTVAVPWRTHPMGAEVTGPHSVRVRGRGVASLVVS